VEQHALDLLKAKYSDFGPTLAHEKLTEVHKLRLSRGSVRWIFEITASGCVKPEDSVAEANRYSSPRPLSEFIKLINAPAQIESGAPDPFPETSTPCEGEFDLSPYP
jgi:hypothetical protein